MPAMKRANSPRRGMPRSMEARAIDTMPKKYLEAREEEVLTRHGVVQRSRIVKHLSLSASVLSFPPVGHSGPASSSRSSFSTLSMLELDEALQSGLGHGPDVTAGSMTGNSTTVQEKGRSDEANNPVDSQTPGLSREASYVNVGEARCSTSGSPSSETHSNEKAPSGVASGRSSNTRSSTESFDRLSTEVAAAQSPRSSPGMKSVRRSPHTPSGTKLVPSVRYMGWTRPLNFRFDIPESTFGEEALQFMGFTKEKARIVFANLCHKFPQGCKDPDPDLLLNHACDYVREMLSKPDLLRGDYHHLMSEIGISRETIDRICAPKLAHGCQELLYTGTLSHWLCDTLVKQYYTLFYLLNRLKVSASVRDSTYTNDACGLENVEEEDLDNVEVVAADEVDDDDEWEEIDDDEDEDEHASEAKEKPTRTTGLDGCDYSDPPHRFAEKLDPKDYCLPSTYLMCDSDPPFLEDHVPLWMATTAGELHRQPMFSEDGFRIPMSGGYAGLGSYWTPQREIAEKYRQWAARRAPLSETFLVRILVPKAFVKNLVSPDLASTESWADWIRYCQHRSAKSKGEQWKDAKDHWASIGQPGLDPDGIMTRIYTGPLAWKPQELLHPDVSLTDANTIRTAAGTRGMHWVFKKTKGLEEQVRNNVHIEVHAPDFIHHPPWENM